MEGVPYILIGPGRWGTRDRFAGIPVQWHQISWARTIVETSMEGFRIAPSYGTHFFHNITSLGVMYLAVPHDSESAFMNWDELGSLPAVVTKQYVRHLRLPVPVVVKVDGRIGRGLVFRPSKEPSCNHA
jgi:hypothetical protein